MESVAAKVPAHLAEERLDMALHALFPNLSRKRIKRIIDEGGAYRNKKRVMRAGDAVRAGDHLELYWKEHSQALDSKGSQLSNGSEGTAGLKSKNVSEGVNGTKSGRGLDAQHLIFICDDYLLVSKPARMPSQATLESTAGTIIEALKTDLKVTGSLLLVHRLDKETSGLLIVARNDATRKKFEEYFVKRMVIKCYLGIASGTFKGELCSGAQGVITDSIMKDSVGHNRYVILRDKFPRTGSSKKVLVSRSAKSAETGYSITAVSEDEQSALFEFYPKTGRTHQIRVHCAQSLGCPLLGDKTYGSQIVGHPVHRQTTRHMLHAWKIKFPCPKSGVYIEFVAPLPDDFSQCLKACGLALPKSLQVTKELLS